MRSRSSLLCHILMSHQNIYGIGESNTRYQTNFNLWKVKLKAQLKFQQSGILTKTFVDQINHNQKTPNLDIILDQKSAVIILVRDPNDAIQSILKLTKEYYEPWTINKAIDYYNERLIFLKNIIESSDKARFHIICSDEIISNKQSTLDNLTKYLQLDSPLTSAYKLFSFSGKHGDPSDTLKASKIVQKDAYKKLGQDLSASYQLYNQIIGNIK